MSFECESDVRINVFHDNSSSMDHCESGIHDVGMSHMALVSGTLAGLFFTVFTV